MLSNAILILCGMVMLLAALMVLYVSHAVELSLRTCGALLVAAAGAWSIVCGLDALAAETEIRWEDLLLPAGIACWILAAAWQHRGHPMRRKTDWARPGVISNPWLPPKG